MEYISQELKINPKEIMAFGDSGNDYKMLKFVGHPVAMKDSFMAKRDFENKTDFTMMRVEWLNIYKNILTYKNLNQILINIQ